MQNAGMDEAATGIKIGGININSLRCADHTTLMAEGEEELQSLLIRVKEENQKAGLKLSIKIAKIMASSWCHHFMAKRRKKWKQQYFILLGFKITADCDGSHKIKKCLFLVRKAIDKPRQCIKNQ